MPSPITIRPARVDSDLPRLAELINPYEVNPVSAERVRQWFEYNPPGRIQRRLVSSDENGAVTGYACIIHEPTAPERQFYAWLVVDPHRRRQGIGSALWQACQNFLREQGAARLKSEVRDDDPQSRGFAERRGLAVDRHYFGSSLDLAAFDETPFLPAIAALEAQGIRFCSLAEFPDTPETRRQLFDLNSSSVLDIPGVTSLPWDFAGFEHFVIDAAWFRRDGQLLALDGSAWVGLSAVSLHPETSDAYNEHTGVRRAYRGRTSARSLKVLAARFARLNGAQAIRTHNDSLNPAILAVNQKMGYRPGVGSYGLVGDLFSSNAHDVRI